MRGGGGGAPPLAEQEAGARLTLERWHPVEQVWKDTAVPLPKTEAETRAEHERMQEREAAESLEKGRAGWEVRVRRSTFPLVGAVNEDEARELAERRQREAPPGARAQVEPASASSGRSCRTIRSPYSAGSAPEQRTDVGFPPASSGWTGRVRILRPLGMRDFALLWTGITVSLLGDGIYGVAIA